MTPPPTARRAGGQGDAIAVNTITRTAHYESFTMGGTGDPLNGGGPVLAGRRRRVQRAPESSLEGTIHRVYPKLAS